VGIKLLLLLLILVTRPVGAEFFVVAVHKYHNGNPFFHVAASLSCKQTSSAIVVLPRLTGNGNNDLIVVVLVK
jgi:hypothetical protein